MDNEIFIPTYQEFVSKVKSIYSSGNLKEAYDELVYHIKNYKLNDEETPVTYGHIMEAWNTSIKLWNSKYGNKKPEYVTQAQYNEKKSIKDFIVTYAYNEEYSLDAGDLKRDEYLFAPWLSIQQLYKVHKNIEGKIDEQSKRVSGE